MSNHQFFLLSPNQCSREQLDGFYDLVLSGGQVNPEGLADRIATAALLAFCYEDGRLAGVASVKNQKRSYIMGIFLKAKVPRLAENYPYELGYAVTHPDFRRMGISRQLIQQLLDSKPDLKFYATTKSDDMRDLLVKSGFIRTGGLYQNSAGETLDLFTFG